MQELDKAAAMIAEARNKMALPKKKGSHSMRERRTSSMGRDYGRVVVSARDGATQDAERERDAEKEREAAKKRKEVLEKALAEQNGSGVGEGTQ